MSDWIKLKDKKPDAVYVDIRTNNGSIILDCYSQSDGDFYNKKTFDCEIFISEYCVHSWRYNYKE